MSYFTNHYFYKGKIGKLRREYHKELKAIETTWIKEYNKKGFKSKMGLSGLDYCITDKIRSYERGAHGNMWSWDYASLCDNPKEAYQVFGNLYG